MTIRCQVKACRNSSMGHQSGVSLVIALILLIVLTLLVLSGVTTGTLSFRIASNMQHEREAMGAAQAAIDARLGSPSYFVNPPTAAVSETIGAYTVVTQAPRCVGVDMREESGKKTQTGVAPIPKLLWELTSTAKNNASGVSVTVVQGVKMAANVGANCPN